jgi:putative chitinase
VSIITMDIMRRRWPHGDQHVPGLVEGIVATAEGVFSRYDMSMPLVIAHFMAQISEECNCGLEMLENMNYSWERLRQVFPTHFTSNAMARHYQHNPRMIADVAYGGRMGNAPPPSDDGWNYRGRGFTQITGLDGVTAAQKILDEHEAGFSIVDDPDIICSPQHALECGAADFIACGCLPPAQADNVLLVTRHLNGGYNGLAERERQLRLWKAELGL